MAPESAARDSTHSAGSTPAVLEGVLEKRSAGVLGLWTSQNVRLSQASLDFTASEDTSGEQVEKYHLESIDKVEASDSLDGDETEISLTISGRLVRLRAETKEKRDSWLAAIQKASHECSATEAAEEKVEEPKKGAASERKRSARARKPDPHHAQPRERLEELYRLHFSRLERLKNLQEHATAAELQRIRHEADAAKALTRSRSAGVLNGLSASERLHAEHRKQAERLEEMRRLQTDLEEHRCKVGGVLCKPGASPEEVSQRLYMDAVRRKQEQNITLATTVQEAKSVRPRPGSPDPTSSTSAAKDNICTNGSSKRFQELYAEAQERQLRYEQRKAQHDEEEMTQLAAHQNKNGKALSIERLQKLHDEHQERLQRKLKAAAKKEAKELQLLKEAQAYTIQQLKARSQSASSSSRVAKKDPLWKPLERLQKPSVKTLTPKAAEEPVGRAVQAKSAGEGCLMVVEQALSLRLFDHAGISFQASDRKQLADSLQAALQLCREVRTQQDRDPGCAALCLRPSERMIGSHLLSDQERWSRRAAPTAHLQVESSLGSLMRVAVVARKMLKEQLAPKMHWPSGGIVNLPSGIPAATAAYDPPCPDATAAELKACTLFSAAGDGKYHRNMLDLVRIELVCSTCDLVQAAVEHLVENFEVLRVNNRFANPARLALPAVEVLLVMRVQTPDQLGVTPHICTVHIEQQLSYDARKKFSESMGSFFAHLHKSLLPVLAASTVDKALQVARNVLNQSSESAKLRALRCQLTRHFGSTVAAWRHSLGTSSGALSFPRFLDACNSMKCEESCVCLWECLEANSSGVISLWDLDPEAVWSLLSFRARVLEKVEGADLDPFSVLASISCHVNVNNVGQLEQHEFRRVCKLLHIDAGSADRIFTLLDIRGGIHHAPPARITKADVAWIMQAQKVFDLKSIALRAFGPSPSKVSTASPVAPVQRLSNGCGAPIRRQSRTLPGELNAERRGAASGDTISEDGANEPDDDERDADDLLVKEQSLQDSAALRSIPGMDDEDSDEEIEVRDEDGNGESELASEDLGIQDEEDEDAERDEAGLQATVTKDEEGLDDLGIFDDDAEEKDVDGGEEVGAEEEEESEEYDANADGIDEGEDAEEEEEVVKEDASSPKNLAKDEADRGKQEEAATQEEAEDDDEEEETW